MEKGKVIKILDAKTVLVKIEALGECEECAGKAFCSHFADKENMIAARYEEKLSPDDAVSIIIKPSRNIILSTVIFFLPLVFMSLFYFAGYIVFKKESAAALISIAGFVLSFAAIIFVLRIIKNREKMLPFAVKEKEI
jgi:positive regulator of sigma E activity